MVAIDWNADSADSWAAVRRRLAPHPSDPPTPLHFVAELPELDEDERRRCVEIVLDAVTLLMYQERAQDDITKLNLAPAAIVEAVHNVLDWELEPPSHLQNLSDQTFRTLWKRRRASTADTDAPTQMASFYRQWQLHIFRPHMYDRRAEAVRDRMRPLVGRFTLTPEEMIRELLSIELKSADNDLLVPLAGQAAVRWSHDAAVRSLVSRVEKVATEQWETFYKELLKGYGLPLPKNPRSLGNFTQLVGLLAEGAVVRRRLQPGRIVKTEHALTAGVAQAVNGLLGKVDGEHDDNVANPVSVARYLSRIGFEGVDTHPSLDTLARIQRGHLDTFVYTNLDLILGRANMYDYDNFLTRLLDVGHGGLCYALNHSMAKVLRRMGYKVDYLWSTVSKVEGVPGTPSGNHLGLQVTVDGQPWLVDVGLGESPREPIPFKPGKYRQGPFSYTMARNVAPWLGDKRSWTLTLEDGVTIKEVVLEDGSVPLTRFRGPAVEQNSPASFFLRQLQIIQRREDEVWSLRGNVLWTIRGNKPHERVLNHNDFFEVLKDSFGLYLGNVTQDERHDLWQRAATQRPPLELSM